MANMSMAGCGRARYSPPCVSTIQVVLLGKTCNMLHWPNGGGVKQRVPVLNKKMKKTKKKPTPMRLCLEDRLIDGMVACRVS